MSVYRKMLKHLEIYVGFQHFFPNIPRKVRMYGQKKKTIYEHDSRKSHTFYTKNEYSLSGRMGVQLTFYNDIIILHVLNAYTQLSFQ